MIASTVRNENRHGYDPVLRRELQSTQPFANYLNQYHSLNGADDSKIAEISTVKVLTTHFRFLLLAIENELSRALH